MDKATVLRELGVWVEVLNDDQGKVPETFLVGARGEHGNALAVVAPKNVKEVQNVVKYAYDHNLRIVPQGARTGLVGGTIPNDDDKTIVMAMHKFKSPPEYREADGRVIVDAGFTLSEINDFLKPLGVCVAIDVSSDPMIGGMAATNIAGSHILRYGDFRDMCVGIQVVFADSVTTLYDTRNSPYKDNSKIDFTKMFVGSFGTLGIITSVALKVYPIISHRVTAWIPVEKDADLSELVEKIKRVSGQDLLACEFISREALNALIASPSQAQSKVTVPFREEEDCDVVFIEWGSASSDFQEDAFLEKTLTQLTDNGISHNVAIVGYDHTWDLRHRLSEAVQHSGQKLIGCDISTTCDRVSELRTKVRETLNRQYPDLIVCDFGHLGDGGFHMNIVIPKDLEWSDKDTLDVRILVSEIAISLGGSFSAEHGLGEFNSSLSERFRDPTASELALSVKEHTDPKGMLGHKGINL